LHVACRLLHVACCPRSGACCILFVAHGSAHAAGLFRTRQAIARAGVGRGAAARAVGSACVGRMARHAPGVYTPRSRASTTSIRALKRAGHKRATPPRRSFSESRVCAGCVGACCCVG
jgi:hypothetical protein